MNPTKQTALEFAIMLRAGMPSLEALRYFVEEEHALEPSELLTLHAVWMKSKLVRSALLSLQGKTWQEMTLEEQMKVALDQHYAQLAYYLYSHNIADLTTTEKMKSDTARQALEAKLAGMAGQTSALDRWFADVQAGRVVLPGLSPASPVKGN